VAVDREALAQLTAEIVDCRRCPRLVAWRERVAREKVLRFRDETYWGRPVPGCGDPDALILLVGLAPAAHGGNRTGRVFTGDASGDFLWPVLHAVGLANQPESHRIDDGLALTGAYLAAAVRCAPPANKPTIAERDNCAPYLVRELALLTHVRVLVALGRMPGMPRSGRSRRSAIGRPRRSRGSVTAPRRPSGRTGSSARTTPASRTPSLAS
jgi:uracil-DNA glycosylase family 4